MNRSLYAVLVSLCAALILTFAWRVEPVTAQAPVVMSPKSPDVLTLGSTADAAVTPGATGSLSGKNRQMSDDLSNIRALLNGTRSVNVAQVGGFAVAATKCEDFAKLSTVAISASASGNTQLVALSSTQLIYVCRIILNVAGALTVSPVYGTGSACATGQTTLDTWTFSALTPEPWGIANTGSVQYKTAASNALCLNLSGSVAVTGSLSYVKE